MQIRLPNSASWPLFLIEIAADNLEQQFRKLIIQNMQNEFESRCGKVPIVQSMDVNCDGSPLAESSRRRIHAFHFPVEKEIYNTILNIERLDNSDDLNLAIIKLRQALTHVSDYYDNKLKNMINDNK